MPVPTTFAPGQPVDLSTIPTRVDTDEYDKKSAYKKIAENTEVTADLARRLYAENSRSLLLILQGMDAAGKDGSVRAVMRGVNPRSCQVHSFKKPSEEELDHDFLWRVHKRVPRKGNIGIFNRSHYEDVLVVRVHNLVPADQLEKRFHQINDFEQMLTENGAVILKCCLHIGFEEQRERLQARIDNPAAHWKVNLGDLEERKKWDDYRAAYNDALTRCNTEHAPWYIVPCDRKWYRSLVISNLVRRTLEGMDPQYPIVPQDYRGLVVE